jgi:hypothetical protein
MSTSRIFSPSKATSRIPVSNDKEFGPDDPVFPKTQVGLGQDQVFMVLGFGPEHWADAAAVWRIFRDAFRRIGLPFGKSYTVPNTLVQFAYQHQFTAEQMKALSQNLRYVSPMMTFDSYGQLTRQRHGEVIAGEGRQSGGVELSQATPADLAWALSAQLEAIQFATFVLVRSGHARV